ncbi:MAG: DUF1002 domain-containing protein [Turicibacter sp.]|nr:DUF1002 domain-containing protein [Turicibacter sp.]
MKLKHLVAGIIAAFTLGAAPLAQASGTQTAAPVDELWGNPIMAFGSSLSDTQFQEMLHTFQVTEDEVDLVNVMGTDVVRLLGVGNPNVQMFSSALIRGGERGSGIVVNILTPENITRVTRNQYANAMITAGVSDAIVDVAAPFPVTGESALAGIFKAYEDRGIELEQDRMAVAQEELETTTRIAEDYAGHEDFESENLDHALIDIKSTLAEIKESTGSIASEEEVAAVVQAALADNRLSDIISAENVQRLVNLANRYQNTSAITSDQVREQLQNLAENVVSGWETLHNAARDSGILEQVGNFFRSLFDMVRGFFE